MLPRVANVTVEVEADRVIVVEDIVLPRGEWRSGGLDLCVAFGAPGVPAALDARIVAAPSSAGDAARTGTDEGEPVLTEPATRCEAYMQPLLGSSRMAGVVARIKEGQLRRAYAHANAARLRLRTLLQPPAVGADGVRDVVVRLGAADGRPLTLGHIDVRSLDAHIRLVRAEASLCGPEADARPLSVTLGTADGSSNEPAPGATLPPEIAVRHASDDLCIRWWPAR